MNYNRCSEFVKSQSEKIDEISEKFDPRFSLAKNLPNLFHSAGIDFESERDGGGVIDGGAGMRTSEHDDTAFLEESDGAILANGDFVPYTNRQYQSPHDGFSGENRPKEKANILRLGDRLFFGGIDGGTSVCIAGTPAEKLVFDDIDKVLELSRAQGRPIKRVLGGLECLVSPAPGGGCIHYHCKLAVGGIVVYLHKNPCKTIPAAKITYSWDVCDRYDLEEIQDCVNQWLYRLGVERECEWLSRLDIQVTASMNLDVFYRSTIDVNYRCRIRKPHFHADGEFPEGVYFGSHSSPIFARLYDKWREAFGNSEEKCVNLMERFEAGNYDVWQNPITRFEFEAHRQLLSAMEINTFRDLKEKGQGYAAYLCSWLRFVEKKNGRHTERERICTEWQEVSNMFQMLFSEECPTLCRKQRRAGGFMTYDQYKRAEATVGTYLAKMLLHNVQRNNSDPKTELQLMLCDILKDAARKFDNLQVIDSVCSSENIMEKLKNLEN